MSPYPLEPLKGTCVEEASVNGLGGEPGALYVAREKREKPVGSLKVGQNSQCEGMGAGP